MIVRRTYPELVNNHIRILRLELRDVAKYVDKDKIFNFVNGSTIQFAYCDGDKDLDRLQGVEFDIIFLDEATQLSEYQIKTITATMRGVNDFPKRCYMTMNPGGQGHNFIRRIFIDRQYRSGEEPEEYEFIQSLVTDNKALMESQPEYVDQLKALPPKLRKAWLEGSWDIFDGMYFEEYRDDPEHYKDRLWTHVIAPFNIPKAWTIYRSFDWGYHRPFSMGYYAIDTDGVMYRFAEFYGVQKVNGEALPNEGLKWAPDRVFAEIQRFESEHPMLAGREIQGVADPAIWDAESGVSYAETAMKYGIFFRPGVHKRVPGWMQCHYRMMFDDTGRPMFYVFNTCREFMRTIPTLQYDEHHTEDLCSDGEDHIADEWRYMCMARPITPVIPDEQYAPKWGSDPLNQYGGKTAW